MNIKKYILTGAVLLSVISGSLTVVDAAKPQKTIVLKQGYVSGGIQLEEVKAEKINAKLTLENARAGIATVGMSENDFIEPTYAPTPTPEVVAEPEVIEESEQVVEESEVYVEEEAPYVEEVPADFTQTVSNEVEYVEDMSTVVSNVPNDESGCRSAFFSYMSYTAVTSKSSPQWKLLRGSECYTDPVSGIRMVGDRYCVAVGSFYSQRIGTKLNFIMEDGSILKCITGDAKADKDTNANNQYHMCDGSVGEFIIDKSVFHSTNQYPSQCGKKIIRIEKVED